LVLFRWPEDGSCGDQRMCRLAVEQVVLRSADPVELVLAAHAPGAAALQAEEVSELRPSRAEFAVVINSVTRGLSHSLARPKKVRRLRRPEGDARLTKDARLVTVNAKASVPRTIRLTGAHWAVAQCE